MQNTLSAANQIRGVKNGAPCNEKTKNQESNTAVGFLFSCLLNNVKNGEAETSSLDGRAVEGGEGSGRHKKNKSQNKAKINYKT